MKKDLTDEQKKALGHVEYEHNMLKFTAKALVKCFLDPNSTCDTQAWDTGSKTPMNWEDSKQENLWNALDACLDNSSTNGGNTNRGNLRDALLESFLVHFRNLYGFYCEGEKYDDMVAREFCEWDIPSADPDSRLSIETKERINKHLSHLTWKRVENSKPKWPPQEIKQMGKEIEEMGTTFRNQCQVEREGPKSLSLSPKNRRSNHAS